MYVISNCISYGTHFPAIPSADYDSDSFRIALSASITSQCVNVQLLEDTIVETDERFSVQVEQVLSSSDLKFGLDPEFAVVTILDNDGMLKYNNAKNT